MWKLKKYGGEKIRLKEKKSIDDDENGIYLEPADEDGFHICEKEGIGRVYVYYSEIDNLIDCIRSNVVNE